MLPFLQTYNHAIEKLFCYLSIIIVKSNMVKKLLLGDEAIAQAAIDAGLSGVYAYPGTPSTEITEYIQNSAVAKERNIHSRWSANEKTAMEEALGMSFMGKRALVCMKHVGLNVCADPFVNSAMTGTNGGLIVLVADDPSMHSSQNEQDSRFYAKFAMIPCLEPSNQQEAYDMVHFAFDYSERIHLPILMRVTTRMAHSRAVVKICDEPKKQNEINFNSKASEWVLLPAMARRRNDTVTSQQAELEKDSFESRFNKYTDGPNHSLGIITGGIGINYLNECYPDSCPYPVLKISHYPLPKALMRRITEECDNVLIIEEGQPFIEDAINGIMPGNAVIKGKLTGDLPRTGELTPDIVKKALNIPIGECYAPSKNIVPRPPALCQGCGHRDVYAALNDVLKEYPNARVFGDIGCYTLGALPPYRALHSTVDMGASITMADITVIISDNLTTAMTGGQDSAGTNKLEAICRGLGLSEEHLKTVVPLPKNMPEIEKMIRDEINYHGVSVIIPCRECMQTLQRHLREKKQKGGQTK